VSGEAIALNGVNPGRKANPGPRGLGKAFRFANRSVRSSLLGPGSPLRYVRDDGEGVRGRPERGLRDDAEGRRAP
jgi:hypothetical protein